jgi:PTH1 family peptidyl-tRNA hydrolase
LATADYPKLRFGIGNDYPKGMQSEFVLGKWRKEEEPLVSLKIDKSVEAIETFAAQGITAAMNAVNNKDFSL